MKSMLSINKIAITIDHSKSDRVMWNKRASFHFAGEEKYMMLAHVALPPKLPLKPLLGEGGSYGYGLRREKLLISHISAPSRWWRNPYC